MIANVSALSPVVERWFEGRGWRPRRHQLDMHERARVGKSALLVAATGAGKTLAGFLPTICDLTENPSEGLHTLYISPLKALAVDVQRNLLSPIEEMDLKIRVETRTGDTPSDRKARQRVRPPQILLTTPESLSLLLSYPESAHCSPASRRWLSTKSMPSPAKRGDLLSLSLARLHALAPHGRVGLSATVADPDAYRGWLAPHGDEGLVDLVIGELRRRSRPLHPHSRRQGAVGRAQRGLARRDRSSN
jgi:ATP-dependent Lhr-like helicase